MFTDHAAVKAVLEVDNPTAKHARWWTRVNGRVVMSVTIKYHAGRENLNADALSRKPHLLSLAIPIAEDEVQVSTVTVELSRGGEDAQAQNPPRLVASGDLAEVGTRELATSSGTGRGSR